jgi:hypothetical protein
MKSPPLLAILAPLFLLLLSACASFTQHAVTSVLASPNPFQGDGQFAILPATYLPLEEGLPPAGSPPTWRAEEFSKYQTTIDREYRQAFMKANADASVPRRAMVTTPDAARFLIHPVVLGFGWEGWVGKGRYFRVEMLVRITDTAGKLLEAFLVHEDCTKDLVDFFDFTNQRLHECAASRVGRESAEYLQRRAAGDDSAIVRAPGMSISGQ